MRRHAERNSDKQPRGKLRTWGETFAAAICDRLARSNTSSVDCFAGISSFPSESSSMKELFLGECSSEFGKLL
eukprot:856198-Rhodomonas_salina.1